MKIISCWYCRYIWEFYQSRYEVPACPKCGAGPNGDPPYIKEILKMRKGACYYCQQYDIPLVQTSDGEVLDNHNNGDDSDICHGSGDTPEETYRSRRIE